MFKTIRTAHAALLKVANELEIFAPCFCHAISLIYRSGLGLTDKWLAEIELPWRYYSGCAKLVHCWRDSARSFFN
eukprot:9973917-Alexandrium_andersonii.AAC.1